MQFSECILVEPGVDDLEQQRLYANSGQGVPDVALGRLQKAQSHSYIRPQNTVGSYRLQTIGL